MNAQVATCYCNEAALVRRAGNVSRFAKAPEQFKLWEGHELPKTQGHWNTGTLHATYKPARSAGSTLKFWQAIQQAKIIVDYLSRRSDTSCDEYVGCQTNEVSLTIETSHKRHFYAK